MIKVRCPHCDQKLGMPDGYAGHRVRCSKCAQPFAVPTVPAAASVAAGAQAPTPLAPSHTAQTAQRAASANIPVQTPAASSEPLDDFEELEEQNAGRQEESFLLQEDPREQAIRLARQQRAKEAVASAKSQKKSAAASKTGRHPDKSGGLSLADRIPEAMRLPIGLVFCLISMITVIAVWVYAARATSCALCFMALFVPIAGALGLKLVTVNGSFLLALLATLLGGLGIGAGKAAVARYVVIPYQQNYVKMEVLTDMPKLLADERYQMDQGESAQFVARDGDFMTCIALFSLVDEGKADPVIARQWAFDILRASNKTNIYALVLTALNSAPDVPKLPEISQEDQPMFDRAYERMAEWEEKETELQNARKYFPALNCVASQCETDRLLQKPDTAFKFALLDTLGFLDILWVLLGMGLAYITLSLD